MGQQSEIKNPSPCEKDFKDYCLNGECYYLVDEDKVRCTVCGGMEINVLKTTSRGTKLELNIRRDHLKLFSKHICTTLGIFVRSFGNQYRKLNSKLKFEFKKLNSIFYIQETHFKFEYILLNLKF